MFIIFDGKLFQSLIVLGQKLYLYSSHDVCTGINFIGSEFPVFITVLCFTWDTFCTEMNTRLTETINVWYNPVRKTDEDVYIVSRSTPAI